VTTILTVKAENLLSSRCFSAQKESKLSSQYRKQLLFYYKTRQFSALRIDK